MKIFWHLFFAAPFIGGLVWFVWFFFFRMIPERPDVALMMVIFLWVIGAIVYFEAKYGPFIYD